LSSSAGSSSDAPDPDAWTGRVAALIGIAAEGVPYTAAAAAAGLVLYAVHYDGLAFLLIILALAIGAFFRDPERLAVAPDGALLSAADGKVTDVSEVALPGGSGERFHRVSVFMSPLNVHVNRTPVTGRVVAVTHTPGEFRAAFHDDASEHNERNLILIEDGAGRLYAMMQVAGYLARRIVCHKRPGDALVRGQRIGMIMFGSRVDHFIPLNYRVTVAPGDRVSAGESVIANIGDV
jgi:phosphatidylserine decarboxylase